MSWLEKLMAIDRRIIFLLVALAVALPIIFNWSIPVYEVTPEVLGVFDRIDALEPGAAVLVDFDYEPAATPELDPMSEAILKHCFKKDLRVVCVTLYTSALGIIESNLKRIAEEYDKVQGVDYTSLGYRFGGLNVVLGLVDSIDETFKEDYYGNRTTELKVMKGLNRLEDFEYLMCLHDDSTVSTWVIYGFENTGIPVGSGCTAVMAPGSYPLLNAGQVTGIIGGLKGAAEYEKALGYVGAAHQGMFSQCVVHVLIILFIILANLGHWARHRRLKNEKGTAPGGLQV